MSPPFKAAIASGLDVARKNPSDFFRTEMAKNFTASLQKVDETTHNPVVTKEGRNGGTYAVRLLAQRYCGWLSSDFEVAVYSLIDKYSYEELQRKAIRENARDGYKDLTKALKESKGDDIIRSYDTERVESRHETLMNIQWESIDNPKPLAYNHRTI